jgi:3-phenylpropionate/trans-cinnamate dioxygenase ferredoxin reductase subunit
VVAGVGAEPNTKLAEQSGLAIDNGISVDAELRTSDPDVFAAGDCCSFPHPLYDEARVRMECWRTATDQAQVAATNMMGHRRPFAAVPSFWSDQYELTVQIVGLPNMAGREVVRRRSDGVDIRFTLAPDGRLIAAGAVGPGTTMARDIRLAERLIERRAQLDPEALVDGQVSLKTLLARLPSDDETARSAPTGSLQPDRELHRTV